MNRVAAVVSSGVVGIGLGALSGRLLLGGTAWNLIPWAVVAIAIGLVAGGWRTALLASGVYGYLLCAVFLLVADTSSAPVAQRILFAATLGLAGPVCAIALTAVARAVRLRVRRRATAPR